MRERIARIKNRNMKSILDERAVKELIYRVTKSEKYREKFKVRPIREKNEGYDRFILSDDGDKILISATSGVAACAGFNYYLKKYCKCFFGPLTEQMNLPDQIPAINGTVEKETKFLYRYFMNYCTFSYTYLFSGWDDYQLLTDWMLMSGVNLVLNIVGHEAVWYNVLKELGYSQNDIDKFICGPAYLPWQWMGNMTGFGGDLTESWYNRQISLSKKITEKLRSFGAEVILPGYYGMVPLDFKEKFPESNPISQGMWVDAFEQPPIISHKDAMFDKVADLFYIKTKEIFSDCNYFSGDPFHEAGETGGIDLKQFGKHLVQKMKQHSPDGVWMLQGWQGNPDAELLSGISKEDVIIISLSADTNYKSEDFFGGYPWIYSTTPNFGGVRKMYGNIRGMLQEPIEQILGKKETAPVGIGMTMEAVEVDEILYDVFGSVSFADEKPNLEEFLKQFTHCRYGKESKKQLEAYKLLCDNVYNLSGTNLFGTKESALCARPSIDAKNVSTWGNKEPTPYDSHILIKTAELMLEDYEKYSYSEGYRLDLTDILRQAIADRGWVEIEKIRKAFFEKDKKELCHLAEKFLSMFDLQETLMRTNKRTLLGNWLKKATDYAQNEDERKMFLFNAKNLITLWASLQGSVQLHDYAHREWSGMIEHFYKKRWSTYLAMLDEYIERQEELPEIDWTEFETQFVLCDDAFPVQPDGDLYCVAQRVLEFLKNN